MSRETPPGRPPGWARSPGSLRSQGGSFPFETPPAPGARRRQGEPPTFREAVVRLEIPIRITALLVVMTPIFDLIPLFAPPLWDQGAWRIGVAGTLSSALTVPTAGALVLALLAVAHPRSSATLQALVAAGFIAALAGLATGVLGSELVTATELSLEVRASMMWETTRALLTAAANSAMAWGVARHGRRIQGVLPLMPTRPAGIELLD